MSAVVRTKIKGKEASRLTEAVAPAAPETEASYAPVPRKNFVDETHLREDRARPYSARSSRGDEEFLRRAYLDADRQFAGTGKDPLILGGQGIRTSAIKLIDSLIGSEAFHGPVGVPLGRAYENAVSDVHAWTKLWLKMDRL